MSTASGPNGDGAMNGVGRRIDRRTFLRSALAGGAAVAAGGLLDAWAPGSGSAGASPLTRASGVGSSARRKGGNLNVGLTGGGSSDTLNPFFGGISAIGTARAQQLYPPLVQLSNTAQLQYLLA
jgi:ABC-type transport system substrate-binding protein